MTEQYEANNEDYLFMKDWLEREQEMDHVKQVKLTYLVEQLLELSGHDPKEVWRVTLTAGTPLEVEVEKRDKK